MSFALGRSQQRKLKGVCTTGPWPGTGFTFTNITQFQACGQGDPTQLSNRGADEKLGYIWQAGPWTQVFQLVHLFFPPHPAANEASAQHQLCASISGQSPSPWEKPPSGYHFHNGFHCLEMRTPSQWPIPSGHWEDRWRWVTVLHKTHLGTVLCGPKKKHSEPWKAPGTFCSWKKNIFQISPGNSHLFCSRREQLPCRRSCRAQGCLQSFVKGRTASVPRRQSAEVCPHVL